MDWIVDPVAPAQFRKETLRVHKWSGRSFLGRGRGDEFLEARIIPKRIEHRIEPEQRGSERGSAERQFTNVRDRE